MADLEAVVLAGGLGTRLRSAVPDLPKVLAPVAGRPFLAYICAHLEKAGINRVIFALGYQAEKVQTWLKAHAWSFEVQVSIEQTPLGTGGAIRQAWLLATTAHLLVLNGDTFCPVDIQTFYQTHLDRGADISLVSVPAAPADRYGTLQIEAGWVRAFAEKRPQSTGWINAGLYCIRQTWWAHQTFPVAFSWEQYLQEALHTSAPPRIYAHQLTGVPFIDIGIPEDYERAQTYLPHYS